MTDTEDGEKKPGLYNQMREWPTDKTETVYYSELIDPVVDAFRFAYDLKRKNRDKDIPYTGYNIGKDERVSCLPADQHLSSGNLIYSEEDQGRDACVEILGLAFQLGMEQGRRHLREKLSRHLYMYDLFKDLWENLIKEIK